MKRKPDTFTVHRAIMDNRRGEGLGIWCHIYLALIDSWVSLSSLSRTCIDMHSQSEELAATSTVDSAQVENDS